MNRACTHFIFWPYDLFPFVLGAPAYKDRDYWAIPSYQGRQPAKNVIHVAGLEEGAERWKRLETLRQRHDDAQAKIRRTFKEHAKAAAPWLAKHPPYKAPRPILARKAAA